MFMRKLCWSALTAVLAGTSMAQADEMVEPSPWETTSYEEVCVASDRLFGLIAPSDHAFDNFISPMTNPVYFEDPRTLTEVRFIALNNELPNGLGGDDIQLYAAQIRAALTENLSIVAAKDGYIVSQSPVLDDGFADVSVGLKYNLFKDVEAQQILSAGAAYSLPIGSTRALQGRTDGEFHLYLTGGTQLFEQFHFLSASGFRIPADIPSGNDMWYWSNHLDWQVNCSNFYLFTESNWYMYTTSGDAFPAPVGGLDLANLGSVGIAGNSVVTGAYGVKYKPARNMEVGLAYEIPYTDREDILKNRVTFDFIIRY